MKPDTLSLDVFKDLVHLKIFVFNLRSANAKRLYLLIAINRNSSIVTEKVKTVSILNDILMPFNIINKSWKIEVGMLPRKNIKMRELQGDDNVSNAKSYDTKRQVHVNFHNAPDSEGEWT